MEKCQRSQCDDGRAKIALLKRLQHSLRGKQENERKEQLQERDAFTENCNVNRQYGLYSQMCSLKVGPGQPLNTEVMVTEFITSAVADCC